MSETKTVDASMTIMKNGEYVGFAVGRAGAYIRGPFTYGDAIEGGG